MPLNLFYTIVQKSQKWPKTQIKGGSCLNVYFVMLWSTSSCGSVHSRSVFTSVVLPFSLISISFSPVNQPGYYYLLQLGAI